jgi:GTP-binding protein YchF
MSISVGIVGLPNVGKSTLFQAVTKKQVNIANYPFATIDPNVGVVAVPDERVDKLAELTKSAKKIYATVEFVDIAGLVAGAHKGEGLGNQFLANIREADAIVYVLRTFPSATIINTQSSIDAVRDKEILDTELSLKDLETVEKRIRGLEKDAKSGQKEIFKEPEVLKKAYGFLEQDKILSDLNWGEDERKLLQNYQLLTMKTRLYLLNGYDDNNSADTIAVFKKNHWPYVIIDVLGELEAGDLSEEERAQLGLSEQTQLDTLIKKCYELLGLITFLTTGPDETRAWTIKKGWKAPQAAGVIHTDFEKNFICAEVINWQDLLAAGSYGNARQKGLIRTEGKEYEVCDGDVIEIKHGA